MGKLQTSAASGTGILWELLRCAVRDKILFYFHLVFFVLITYNRTQNCQKRSTPIKLTFFCRPVAKSVVTALFCSYSRKSGKAAAKPAVGVLVTGDCLLLFAELKTSATS